MPLITPVAPYDTLATVTSLVRTILADYIRGLNPAPQSVVNTNGTAVTWVSGARFTIFYRNTVLSINGMQLPIASVNSLTSITLGTAAAVQNGVPCIAAIPTGDIFADSEAYVLPTVNLAWRKLQKKLDTASHPRMRNTIDISRIPVLGTQDPTAEQWISWSGFFDGATQTPTPALPPDFLSPLRLFQRQSVAVGVTNPAGFCEMFPAADGLQSFTGRFWDWREDAIYLKGSNLLRDFRIEYQAFLPDIVAGQGGFGSTVIPIMRCVDALAYYTAALFVTPRGGSAIAAGFEAEGDEAVDTMPNRQAKLDQRKSFRRRAVYDSAGRYRRYR